MDIRQHVFEAWSVPLRLLVSPRHRASASHTSLETSAERETAEVHRKFRRFIWRGDVSGHPRFIWDNQSRCDRRTKGCSFEASLDRQWCTTREQKRYTDPERQSHLSSIASVAMGSETGCGACQQGCTPFGLGERNIWTAL